MRGAPVARVNANMSLVRLHNIDILSDEDIDRAFREARARSERATMNQ